MSPVRLIEGDQRAFFPAPPPQYELRPDQLDTQQRLKALWEDHRAGFLPTTNAEKNQAITLLDYIDNPKYPAGIGSQLQEVFIHQRQDKGLVEARRALMSIAFEFGDYLINANEQVQPLEQLARAISDCPNPYVSLEEELGKDHVGFAPFVRFLDLSEMRDRGFVRGIKYSPMRSWSDRTRAEGDKNKIVEDPYTKQDRREAVTKRIEQKIKIITIGDARSLSVEALEDQKRRADFWEKRLRETRAHGAAWIIGKQILAQLDLPLKVK